MTDPCGVDRRDVRAGRVAGFGPGAFLLPALALVVALAAGCSSAPPAMPSSGPIAQVKMLGSDQLRHTSTVVSLALSADGKVLAAGDCAGRIKVYRARTGKLLQTLTGHRNTVISLSLNADGSQLLSGGEDATVRLWDTDDGKQLMSMTDPDGAVWSVLFSGEDSSCSSGDEAGIVRMISIERGRTTNSFKAHTDRVTCIRQISGLRFVTTSFDGTVRLWAARMDNAEVLLTRHAGAATSFAVSPDGATGVSCGFDGCLRLIDLKLEKAGAAFGETKGNYFSVAFVGRREVMSVKDDGEVAIWRVPEGTLVRRTAGHHDAAWCAVSDGDGRAWTGGADNAVRCWDTGNGKELLLRPGHQHEVRSVTFSANGAQLYSEGRDGKRLAWDLARGEIVGDAPAAETRPAPRFQTICDSNTLALWDDEKRVMLWQVPIGGRPVAAAARADGSVAVAITETAISLLDGSTGATLATLPDAHAPSCLALSPDGTTLAVGHRDTTISIYRLNPPTAQTTGQAAAQPTGK